MQELPNGAHCLEQHAAAPQPENKHVTAIALEADQTNKSHPERVLNNAASATGHYVLLVQTRA